MEIQFGCECIGKGCSVHDLDNNSPVAYIVKRDNMHVKVCTRCMLSSDEVIQKLFDQHSNAKTFIDYDALGAFVMLGDLAEENEESTK